MVHVWWVPNLLFTRLMPPNDETRSSDEHGGMITLHFDDRHHEALIFNADGNLNGTGSYSD